jgi:FKBP-type peptidyl-prolyl cis-trans isomerase SlyD
MCVTKNIVVYFRYVMKNNKGHVVESIMEGFPKCYLHGSTGILPSLQLQFESLRIGDTKLIHLKKESGLSNEEFTFSIVIDNLRPALAEELMLGYPVSTNDLTCDVDCDCNSGQQSSKKMG